MTSTPYHNTGNFNPPVTPYLETAGGGGGGGGGGGTGETSSDRFATEELNKSDSEKVLAKKLGSVNFRTDDLDILYNARGKEIERLERQMTETRAEYETQLREARHQLALARSENHSNNADNEELQAVIQDTKRENKVLTEEIHSMTLKMKSLKEDNTNLVSESENNSNMINQLHLQLSQLQSSDAVLKARQQHDAMVRSLLDRHQEELSLVRKELDRANSQVVSLEQERTGLKHQLSLAVTEREEAVRSKLEAVSELSSKLSSNIRSVSGNISARAKCWCFRSQSGEELSQCRAELGVERRERERETAERRRLEREVEQLRTEVGAMEALNVGQDDSMRQLSNSRNLTESLASVSGNQRVREELHRSLVSNRTKREEISRLEQSLATRDKQIETLTSNQTEHLQIIDQLKIDVLAYKTKDKQTESFSKTKSHDGNLVSELAQLEKQNSELKKHISEMVEANDVDKQEAIDELREEYELQVQEAVDETKALMDAEIKKLKIETEVYDKTLLEKRRQFSKLEETNQELRRELTEIKARVEAGDKPEECEARLTQTLKKEFELKLETERENWKAEAALQTSKAVATAKIEWLQNLPELDTNTAVRQSRGEMENIKALFEKEKSLRENLLEKFSEKDKEVERLKETQRVLKKQTEEARREGQKEAEERLGSELKQSLRQQQDQWETIVNNTRSEAEESRKQLVDHWEGQVELLEQKVKKVETEKLESLVKERQLTSLTDQLRRTLQEKEAALERLNKDIGPAGAGAVAGSSRKEREVLLLQEELQRRNVEVERQREEMSSLASKWREEMENIQSSHTREKQELEEVRSKYHQLKTKVRKYHKNVEAKEVHYKSEYARLETEFRQTLEKLRAKVETAYCVKEKQVDTELGNMREQLTQEMRKFMDSKGNQSTVKLWF